MYVYVCMYDEISGNEIVKRCDWTRISREIL